MRINSPYITGSAIITGNLCVQGTITGTITGIASTASYAETLDGLDSTQFVQTGSFNSYTSSASSSLGDLSGSVSTTTSNLSSSIGSLSGSVATTTSGLSSSIGSLSGSISGSIGSLSSSVATTTSDLSSSIGSISSSVATTTSGLGGRITTIEGRYATTGSNTFVGSQVITGSLYISSDLVVQGSSSLQNITASAVNIGANIVNLNTANPAIRFAGLNIFDSGSIGGSGSFLYDAVEDEFIFVHRGDNANITSSVVLMGPQTYNNIGNETYPTVNRILKGVGNEHVGDSCIIDDGTTVCVNANLKGSGTACFGGTITVPSVSLGAGGSVDNLSNINYGGYTWGSYNTSNGTITFSNVTGCGIKFATGEACFASAINSPGGTISQDLRIYRSGGTTTGYINFGSTGTNYFGFDGTKYVANGVLASTNGLFSGCVGIGATTVGAQLHIEKDGSDVDVKFTDVGVGSFMMGLRDGCARFEIASGNCLGTNTALSIDTSGRVGLSTNPATYTLSVGGRGYFFATNQDSGWGQLTLDYGNGTNSNIQAIQMKEGGAINASIGYGSYGSSSCGDIVMWTNDGGGLVERMRILATGSGRMYVEESTSNVNGFGVVGRTCSKAVYLGANTTYGYVQSHGSVPLRINELGNHTILNLGGDNVGIGTASVTNKLTVVGCQTGTQITTTPIGKFVNLGNSISKLIIGSDNANYDAVLSMENNATLASNKFRVYIGNGTTSTAGHSNDHIVLQGDGKVGVGTDALSGTAKLLVNGGIGFAGDTDKYLFMPDVGQGTGSIYMQAGFGSAQAGGAVRLYGHNATSFTGGDVEVGLSGKGNFLINSYIGGGRLVTVKVNGNVGLNDTNPQHKIDVNGNARFQDTTMIGSSVGLLQFAMDGARWNSYPNSVLHIKTSILKGSDTMIAFNIRGYMYSPNTVDTDVAFYNYNPTSSPYGVTIHHKAYGGWSIGLYYSSDNYVCIYVDGMSTYGGFVLNWINTSLIQWGGRVFALASTKVNTTAAQY